MTYGVAGRIAAAAAEVPMIDLSIYPQLLAQQMRPSRFASDYLSEVDRVSRMQGSSSDRTEELAWGRQGESILLHDPSILDNADWPPGSSVVGFPYWDELPVDPVSHQDVLNWLGTGNRPVVLITLGSFIGHVKPDCMDRLASSIVDGGRRVLILNGRPSGAGCRAEDHIMRSGFLPLSSIMPAMSEIAHHGGIGTSFAALRSGLPSMVLPQAFDQPYMARLLEKHGLGCEVNQDRLGVGSVSLPTADMHARAHEMGARLVPSHAAAAAAADRILGVVSG